MKSAQKGENDAGKNANTSDFESWFFSRFKRSNETWMKYYSSLVENGFDDQLFLMEFSGLLRMDTRRHVNALVTKCKVCEYLDHSI